jgi:hypothetical protein
MIIHHLNAMKSNFSNILDFEASSILVYNQKEKEDILSIL